MTKCTCGRLLVKAYVADTSHIHKKHEGIGLICLNCDSVREMTPFFLKKKQEIQKKRDEEEQFKIKTRSNPKFRKTKETCSKCKATYGIKIIAHQEKLHIEFDEGRDELVCNKNNPYLECKCKCGYQWTKGLDMPNKPKYLLPINTTKEKLRLAFLRIGSQKIHIPNKYKKMAMEVHRELSAERQAKEDRELEEKLNKKS